METGTVKWSEEMYSIYEDSRENFIPSFEGFISKLHNESVDAARLRPTSGFLFDFSRRCHFRSSSFTSNCPIISARSYRTNWRRIESKFLKSARRRFRQLPGQATHPCACHDSHHTPLPAVVKPFVRQPCQPPARFIAR